MPIVPLEFTEASDAAMWKARAARLRAALELVREDDQWAGAYEQNVGASAMLAVPVVEALDATPEGDGKRWAAMERFVAEVRAVVVGDEDAVDSFFDVRARMAAFDKEVHDGD